MFSLKNVLLFFIYISFYSAFAFQELPVKDIKSTQDFNKVTAYFEIFSNPVDKININITDKHKELLKKYEKWAIKHGTEEDVLLAEMYIIRYVNRGNEAETIAKSIELLNNKKVFEIKEVVGLLFLLRNAYSQTVQYDEVLNTYELYSEQFLKHYPNEKKPGKYRGLAGIHYRLKNYEKASYFFKEKAIDFYKAKKYFGAASSQNNIGLCFFNLHKLDSAQYYYEKAIATIEILEAKVGIKPESYTYYLKEVIRANIASIFVEKGQYNKALPFFLKELSLSKSRNDSLTKQTSYYKIANVYYLKNNTKKTLQYIDSTFMSFKGNQSNSVKEKAFFLKAKTILKAGNFKESEIHFKIAQNYKDSLNNVTLEKRYALATIKYETKKRVSELKESRRKNEIDNYIKFFQKIGLFVLIFLLIILFLFLSKILKNKKLITAQKNIAEKTSEEKEILLKEVHHRVKNNLQVISSILELQSLKYNDEKLTEALEIGQNRIQAMSLIHQQLYRDNNLKDVLFKEYIETLITYIKASNTKILSTIKFNLEVSDYKFPISTAVTLGLIINELITNSYKHAFVEKTRGNIFIKLNKIEANQFCLIVEDDGIGFVKDIDKIDSLGLKLVQILSKQLGGKMTYKSEIGSQFIIDFRDDVAV